MRLLRSSIFQIALVLTLFSGGMAITFANSTPPEKFGIAAKKPVLAAACKQCPWGALADVVKQALAPYGYDVQVCYNCSRLQAPKLVSSAGVPEPVEEEWARAVPAIPRDQLAFQIPQPPQAPVDFGITGANFLYEAYHGTGPFKHPRSNLRLIANI